MALVSTGLAGLDQVLCGLKKGDNVVWQVDDLSDYQFFVRPYVENAISNGRKVIYIRFAAHKPVLENRPEIRRYDLNPASGFEAFSTRIHQIISREGIEAHYVFDCLSDLLSAWATDLMIGNFFMVTCPYLFELDTIAYFAVLRNHHSFHTIARIRETTQLLLDVYNFEGNIYIHPLKVWKRYSPTMFLPHAVHEGKFSPLTSSLEASKLFSHISERGLQDSARQMDHWDRLFLEAEELLSQPEDSADVQESIEQLCRIMVGRDNRISALAAKTFSLEDLLNIKSRLIGSGYIGGKTAGMLLARKVLSKDSSEDWQSLLEPHDSFYIGSDVFYTYIVENGWWKLFMQQKTPEGYFSAAAALREQMISGKFPDPVRQQFQEIIEYFGQSPIIVRSSSLLEDSFGNAFAGKYETRFLVNQGGPELRYAMFEDTVRRIFASTMNENALTYRLQRGLDKHDEQMALLVQRVSGAYQNHYFFPSLAGVGVSYNTFVWNSKLDPKAGMLRLVFGLGTRAVDRVDDDYPQTIALDDPLVRPYADREEAGKFSQHKIDLLDIEENTLSSLEIRDLLKKVPAARIEEVFSTDHIIERKMRELGRADEPYWIVSFKKLLSDTDFPKTMQKMLKSIESYYQYPIDIEFTANFTGGGDLKINLLQCRPLQTKGQRADVRMPEAVAPEKIIIQSQGYTMGGGICQTLRRIIYVEPAEYISLPQVQKYEIARIIGRLNRMINREERPMILLGPGRWGTSTPSLGIPVKFAEINNTAVLAEIAQGDDLIPDLSFGTHFFQDLVENDIFYLAVFPKLSGVIFNPQFILSKSNLLTELLPEAEKAAKIIHVYDPERENLSVQIASDVTNQKTILYFEPREDSPPAA